MSLGLSASIPLPSGQLVYFQAPCQTTSIQGHIYIQGFVLGRAGPIVLLTLHAQDKVQKSSLPRIKCKGPSTMSLCHLALTCPAQGGHMPRLPLYPLSLPFTLTAAAPPALELRGKSQPIFNCTPKTSFQVTSTSGSKHQTTLYTTHSGPFTNPK